MEILKNMRTEDLLYIFRLNLKETNIITAETCELFKELEKRYFAENRVFNLPKIIAHSTFETQIILGAGLLQHEMNNKTISFDYLEAEYYFEMANNLFEKLYASKMSRNIYTNYIPDEFFKELFGFLKNAYEKFYTYDKKNNYKLGSYMENIQNIFISESEVKSNTTEKEINNKEENIVFSTVKSKKVAKSKLRKDEMEKILKNIKNYSKEDQKEYILYASKKWNRDILAYVPSDFLTEFILENEMFEIKDTIGTNIMCPLNMLSKNMNFINLYKNKGFKDVYEYKKYLKNHYMKRPNATEKGFNYYFSLNLFKTMAHYKTCVSEDFLEDFRMADVFLFATKIINILEKNEEFSFIGLNKTVKFPCSLFSYSTDNEISSLVPNQFGCFMERRSSTEFFVKEANLEAEGEATYFELLKGIINMLMNLHIFKSHTLYLQGKKLEASYDEFDVVAFKLNKMLEKIVITEKDVEAIEEYIDNSYSSNYSKELDKVIDFILIHLCHTENIKEFANLVTKDVETITVFWRTFQYYNSRLGIHSYKTAEDVFFTIYKSLDNINLSTPEKRFIFFQPSFSPNRVNAFPSATERFKERNESITTLLLNSLEKQFPELYAIAQKYAPYNRKYDAIRHIVFNENGKVLCLAP